MTPQTTTTRKLYIGIDIHKRSWKIQTATDISWGKAFTAPPDADTLFSWVQQHFPEHQVSCAYEAGCCGFEPARYFMEFGWHTIVFNPADISRTGTSAIIKTDKIDARLICKELKDQRLKSIHIPSRKREELRALFRRRVALVRDFRRIKSQIKMQLLYLGIEVPKEFDQPKWSHAFRDWIRSLKGYFSTGTLLFQSLMNQYDFIDKELRGVSVQLRAYCRKHYKQDYYLLRSVPGIGGIVACGILSELGDLRRFTSAKQLSAYVGFMPYIKQSGDHTHTFGISPRANHIMRSYFIEAAWQAIRVDPVMQEYYRKHQGKNSKRIIVKIAHKLLNRTRAVIMTQTPYEIGVME